MRCSTLEQNEVRQLKTMEEQEVKKVFIDKASGKNTDRKSVAIDEANFRAVCARWRAGEITATTAMQEVGLRPNTFYRRVKKLKL